MKDPAVLAAEVLQQVAKLIGKLTIEQLNDFADGRAIIAFQSGETVITATGRKGRSTASRSTTSGRLSVAEVAARLPELTDRDEAAAYLQNSKITVAGLEAVAAMLGKTRRGRRKDDIINNLAEDTVGFRQKHEAMLGGAYQR